MTTSTKNASKTTGRLILLVLRGGLDLSTVSLLSDVTGKHPTTIRKSLQRLVSEKFVAKTEQSPARFYVVA